MSELRKTPPLQLLLGKEQKNPTKSPLKKKNSCYSERISALPSVPLEFSVWQSISNNQEKSLVAVISITLCISTWGNEEKEKSEEKLLTLTRTLTHSSALLFLSGGLLGWCSWEIQHRASLLGTPLPSMTQAPSALCSLAAVGPDGHGGVLHHETQPPQWAWWHPEKKKSFKGLQEV